MQGLAIEASPQEELVRKPALVVPELVELNGLAPVCGCADREPCRMLLSP